MISRSMQFFFADGKGQSAHSTLQSERRIKFRNDTANKAKIRAPHDG